MPKSLTARLVAIICLTAALLLGGYWFWAQSQRSAAPAGSVSGTATIGGGFTLIDQNGQMRSDAEFRGRFMLVYFGFTFCEDVCPLDLKKMSDALVQLEAELGAEAAAQIQPIFVTIDPARDTPEYLKDYMQNFHPAFVALTGEAAALEALAKAYRVWSERAEGGSDSDYQLNHSSILYLMDRDGRFLAHFGAEVDATGLAAGLADALK